MAEQELSNLEKLKLARIEKEKQDQLEKQTFTYDTIAEMTGYKKEQLLILQKTVAKGTTPAEFAYFLQVCISSKLNPINKEIWCYKNNKGDLLVFAGRDGFLQRNKQNPLYRGMRSSDVMEFDEFELDMIEGIVKHKISTNRGKVILGAYAIVYVEGQKDVIVWLDFDEYNLGMAKWKDSPKMMIKKCAQSAALKEAAGLSGIQIEDAYYIKDGIAYNGDSKTQQVDKEEERILAMIENAKSVQGLSLIEPHCKTDKTKEALKNKLIQLETNSSE